MFLMRNIMTHGRDRNTLVTPKTVNINVTSIPGGNFGDAVNGRFWSLMSEKLITSDRDSNHYLTTGSIMCLATPQSVIFGTGFIGEGADLGGGNFQSKHSRKFCNPLNVIAVRGPLSRKKLLDMRVECPENYGDPLLLMPCIYNKQKKAEEKTVGIIPHYIDKTSKNYLQLKENLESNGYTVKFIDIVVGANYEKIIDEINSCEYIISSSLHGTMMGIVYKKKTIFTEFSKNVIGNGFKFDDFFKSVNTTYEKKNIYDISLLDNVIDIDYEYLKNVGIKLIGLVPFIDDIRKQELKSIYSDFYTHQSI